MPLSEHVYCVAVTFTMTEQVEQWICITCCIKLEHSSVETIGMIQKATAVGNWWLAASSRQRARSCITSRAELFAETSSHPGDLALLQPRFGALRLLDFPQTQITFERGEIQTVDEIQENMMGQLMTTGRTVWGPKVDILNKTEASLSYVQYFLYLLQ